MDVRRMRLVGAEHLIALEGVLAELSSLYVVAKEFRPLRARAEHELLRALSALGARLRQLVRMSTLDEAAVEKAAAEIAALRQEWHDTLAQLRASSLYQSCLVAWNGGRAHELITLLPQLFSDCAVVAAPPALFHPVSPSSGRRRPGHSPFLTAPACAERIRQLRNEGIVAEAGGKDWWDTELVSISLATDAQLLESPIALRFDAGALGVPLFETSSGESLRAFAARLVAPFTVVLQPEVDDEWWQAFAGSYAAWRNELAQELTMRGITVDIQTAEGAENE